MKKLLLILSVLLIYIYSSLGAVFAQGVTVSGKLYQKAVSTKKYDRHEGTIYLLKDDAIAYTAEVKLIDVSGKMTSTFSFSNVEPGDYHLRATLTNNAAGEEEAIWGLYEGNGSMSENYKPITVATADITNLDLRTYTVGRKAVIKIVNYDTTGITVDSSKTTTTPPLEEGGESVTVKIYDTTYTIDTTYVAGATVNCTERGVLTTQTTDSEGKVKFSFSKGSNYEMTVSADGYKVYERTLYFTSGGSSINAEYVFELRKKEIYTGATVKVSGAVTVKDGDITDAKYNKLKVGISVDNGQYSYASPIASGRYNFDAVARGNAKFEILEVINGVDKKAFEYRVFSDYDTVFALGENAEEEKDVVIERFASVVNLTYTGTLLPNNYYGFGYLVKTVAPFDTVSTARFADGSGVFRGVVPGTYTLKIDGRGFELSEEPASIVVTKDADKNVTISLIPTLEEYAFSIADPVFNNKYLDSAHYRLHGASIALYSIDKQHRWDSLVYSTLETQYLHATARKGDKLWVKMTHHAIRPVEKEITVTPSATGNVQIAFEESEINFIPVAFAVKNLKGTWNPAVEPAKVELSWSWPEKMLDLHIASISVKRSYSTAEAEVLKTWNAPDMTDLPTAYTDITAEKGRAYTYTVSVVYEQTIDVTMESSTDVNLRVEYMLEYKVNDNSMGEITSSYSPGEYMVGTEITLTATPKEGYLFRAWINAKKDTVCRTTAFTLKLMQDTSLTALFYGETPAPDTVRYTLTLLVNDEAYGSVSGEGTFIEGSTVTAKATAKAGYLFKEWMENGVVVAGAGKEYSFVLNADRTLTAVFVPEQSIEDLEADAWYVHAENGTLVINGLNGDQYTVYDLNGRVMAQARCTGGELRIGLKNNQLYMVRRLSATGVFGVKKIVVR